MGVNTKINKRGPDHDAPDMEGPAARSAQPAGLSGIAAAGPAQPAEQHGIVTMAARPAQAHEDEKTAIVVGGVALGLLSLWLLR